MSLLKQAIVIAIAFCLLSLLILVGVGVPSDSSKEPKNEPPFYISIIEAGTEDSKIYSYKFDQQENDPNLILLETNYVKVKPGLFAIADTPSETDAGVISLIAHVDAFVPSEKRTFSPLLLRAPSSLQDELENPDFEGESKENQDPSEKNQKGWTGGPTPLLLRAARGALLRSGYAVPGLESAMIIDTQHRALYSWYAANYVIDNFKFENASEATIEFEWDSLKVTYELYENNLELLDPKDVYEIAFQGKTKKIFSKSYKNLGLLDLRLALLELENDSNNTSWKSSCINPDVEDEPFLFKENTFKVSGSLPGQINENGKNSVDILKCQYFINQINLEDLNEGPDQKNILPHLLPGFLEQSKVVISVPNYKRESDSEEDFNTISGKKYLKHARETCSAGAASGNNGPFACSDLLLLRKLLISAFGFDDDEQTLVVKSVQDKEINWALGFAHSQLAKHIALSTVAN